VIADVNTDRSPDVVTANSDGKSASVLRNRGNGTFAARHDYRIGSEAVSVAVAELNGDRHPDLVVRSYAGRSFSILLNRGDGTFGQRQLTDVAAGCCDALSSADLNGDGRADVVTRSGEIVSVFLNRGDGSFMPGHDYDIPAGDPGGIVVADLNRDSRPDIATENPFRSVSVLLNNGDGTFGPQHRYKARLRFLRAADLNRDGALDLVGEDDPIDEMGVARVLLNRGHGTFRPTRTYPIGSNLGQLAIADLNGDSAPELIGQYEARVAVLANRGNGTFRSRRTYHTPWFFDFTVADVNGGAPDLVFSSWDLGRVGALLNRGHGKFRALLQYRTLDGPTSLAVADLNGDRSRDVLTLSDATLGGGDRVSVLLNKPGLCNVQDVFQKNLLGARATLARGGCRLGRVRWGYSTVKRGLVMAQRPRFGAVLRDGGRVNIVLSLGRRR
jgi:FG-GAP-like repeat